MIPQKIIISHDIDHLTALEHYKDPIIPKFLLRSIIEKALNSISWKEFLLRFQRILINRWHNIPELLAFNKANNIPATFFIGTNQGRCLAYSIKESIKWCKIITSEGFDVGVHGIEYQNLSIMKEEYIRLLNCTKKNIGIRMHYLKLNKDTLLKLERIGYLFDSSILIDKNPFKIGNLWEFPIHIMDTYIFYENKRFLSKDFSFYKEKTLSRLQNLKRKRIKYITILFHDRYFSEEFAIIRDWYLWLIDFLKKKNYIFISYREAIEELESYEKERKNHLDY